MDLNKVSYVPLNKEKTIKDFVKDFCSFLNNIKTPADIFEEIQINRVQFRYACEYAACVDFNLDWVAKVTKKEQDTYTQYYDRDHANSTVAVTIPANTNELSELDKKFFINSDYILLALAQEITNDIKLLKTSELDNEALDFCRKNTSDIENFDINSMINNQINLRAEEIYRTHYKECSYSIEAADLNMSETVYFSVLVPILYINYTYKQEEYHCYINAHTDSKASIINHKGIYTGTIPKDENKGKGLFCKIKSTAAKINHKNKQKKIYEQKFINIFENYLYNK